MTAEQRVLVCGGRNFNDWGLLDTELTRIAPGTVIHGGASGADRMAGEWAERNGVPCRVEFPDWSYGKAAGPMRNQKMLDDHAPDLVLAFPGGRGTADMVRRAKAAGIPVREIS